MVGLFMVLLVMQVIGSRHGSRFSKMKERMEHADNEGLDSNDIKAHYVNNICDEMPTFSQDYEINDDTITTRM